MDTGSVQNREIGGVTGRKFTNRLSNSGGHGQQLAKALCTGRRSRELAAATKETLMWRRGKWRDCSVPPSPRSLVCNDGSPLQLSLTTPCCASAPFPPWCPPRPSSSTYLERCQGRATRSSPQVHRSRPSACLESHHPTRLLQRCRRSGSSA